MIYAQIEPIKRGKWNPFLIGQYPPGGDGGRDGPRSPYLPQVSLVDCHTLKLVVHKCN